MPGEGKKLSAAGERARKMYRAADDKVAELAGADPYAAYPKIHADMAAHLSQLVRDERRSGEKPSREVTDRIREYRQLTEALNEYNRTRADAPDVESFLSSMEARLSQANLGEGWSPVVERPS